MIYFCMFIKNESVLVNEDNANSFLTILNQFFRNYNTMNNQETE